MFKKYPLSSRTMVFLLIPAFILFYYVYSHIEESLPLKTGELSLSGLHNNVEVHFDENGLASVVAQSDHDAYFAQGYVHASERAWQMELQQRLTSGKLSEIFGQSTVSTDLFMRTLGLQHSARKAWDSISPESQQALTAYANGVNAWLANSTQLPPEFLFFNIKPHQWSPLDSLAWQKAFALNLGKNMDEELNRLAALKIISPEQLKTFYQYDPVITDSTADEIVSIDKLTGADLSPYRFDNWPELTETFRTQWSIGERFAGSNAWVVDGRLTESSSPLLSNDPHLTLQHPSIWYAMQLKSDKLSVQGMSMVGIPGVILGRNKNIAWGATALMSDQQDLFILDIPVDDNKVYMTDGGRKLIEKRVEQVQIRADMPESLNKKISPIEIQIRETEFGPIVSDVINGAGQVMALRWAALDPNDTSFDAFYNIQYATNWKEFRQAAKLLVSPGINFVYADTEGNIGSQAAGKLPARSQGVGILPVKAFHAGNNWQGYVPFDKMPSQFNPESGIIVSANSEIEAEADIIISHEWASDTRKRRISQLLNNRVDNGHKLSVEDMIDIQLDQLDLGAEQVLPILTDKALTNSILQQAPENLKEISQNAIEELTQWNARYSTDSSAATVYHYWYRELIQQIFSPSLDEFWNGNSNRAIRNALYSNIDEQQLVKILTNSNNFWCQTSTKLNVCEKELITSFLSAIRLLKKHTQSNTSDEWQWGNMHHVKYSHRPFGEIKLLDKFFSEQISSGGSTNTVNVANMVVDPAGGFKQTFGATFRQTFDLSTNSQSYYSLSTGQSGHILSDNYLDMMKPFIDGKNHNYDLIENVGVNPTTASTLILSPKGNN